MKDIAVVLPTRGMIYAETLLSLQAAGLPQPIIVNGLPIPDCHNEGVKTALANSPSYILFMEDDMVLPNGAIEQMIKKGAAITAINYPMDNGYETICKKGDEILWCGLGCTLMNASIFKHIPQPWFETDHSYRIKDPFELERIEIPSKYGGHDINFCMKARKHGYTIASLEGTEALHLRNKALERNTRSNNGKYEVYLLPQIVHRQQY